MQLLCTISQYQEDFLAILPAHMYNLVLYRGKYSQGGEIHGKLPTRRGSVHNSEIKKATLEIS